MNSGRYFLLVAGVIGVFAIFAPLINVNKGFLKMSFSAKELALGIQKTESVVDKVPNFIEKRLPPSVAPMRQDFRDVLLAAKAAIAAFIPALMLLLIGIVTLFVCHPGKFIGAVSLLLSIASIVAYFALRWGLSQLATNSVEVGLTTASYLLLPAGGVGAVGALMLLLAKRTPR